ncbi:MAG TPA: imidazole glycerol phosphate synthase subunit HisH [Opitutaceae bacterium]|nr:imidazole glycerol phosphate synthase subunit HisH [Opitutaceae bacterium]HUJ43200.1 imidazole glycerol phosphate synthase subunit HisH [Opitutaceae bacterium]
MNPPPARIAVIDTGICNLRSVTKALESVGAQPVVVRTPAALTAAAPAGLVLPGVGALRDCVAALNTTGLAHSVRGWLADDRPFLGVCLGLQALFEFSEEGAIAGLGIFPGEVRRFRLPPDLKIPHMGWNTVRFLQPTSPFCAGLRAEGEAFYFLHSYHVVPAQRSLVMAECDYGGGFVAAVARGHCFATQFHPEKSQARGLQLYRNFAMIVGARPENS